MEISTNKPASATLGITQNSSASEATKEDNMSSETAIYSVVDMSAKRRNRSSTKRKQPKRPPPPIPPYVPSHKAMAAPERATSIPPKSALLLSDLKRTTKTKKNQVPPMKPVPYHIYIKTKKTCGVEMMNRRENYSTGTESKVKKKTKSVDLDSDLSSNDDSN